MAFGSKVGGKAASDPGGSPHMGEEGGLMSRSRVV